MDIEIQNLTKLYSKQRALNNINIRFNFPSIVGLLGANGAGKSTLMKSIASAIQIEEGDILIGGKSVKDNGSKIKNNIGYLPENNPLYPEMYVKEYLSFVSNIHRLPNQEVDKVIDKVGLETHKNKKIKELSKGYKQRVGIAQAIIHNPKILILDEPTNGLDPNQIVEIRNLILDLSKNKLIILSTHIMQEVEALCKQVILLHQGKLIQNLPIESFKGKFPTLEKAFFYYTNNSDA